jgi:hypothetical protein
VWLIKDQDDDLFLVHSESDVWLEQDAAAMASITADVREAASNGSIVVIIGTGGNRNAYHTGSGDWQAGGTTGGALQFLAYSPPNALPDGGDLFYAGGNGNGSVNSSPDAATNWTVTATGFSDVRGIAILGAAGGSSAGYAVVLGQSGVQPRFALSVSGGNSVWSGTQQPPDAATAESPGTLCGAPQSPNSAVYHAMHCNGGARIRTAYAEDGFTWQSGTTIEAPAGLSFSATPRMIQCQTTGLFVLLAPVTVTQLVLYVSRDFVTWSDPRLLTAVTTAFGVAGGRIFYTTGGVSRIFASEAIGVVA